MSRSDQPYGSFLLGSADQSVVALRWRVQTLLSVILLATHVLGALIAVSLTTWVLPHPPTSHGMTVALAIAVPTYVGLALVVGTATGTALSLRTLRWLRRGEVPDGVMRQRTLEVPLRLTLMQAGLWIAGALLFCSLALIFQRERAFNLAVTVVLSGLVVSAIAYLLTEFAMRPIAARVLDDNVRRRPRGLGLGGRMVLFWLLGSGAPVVGLVIASIQVLAGAEVTARRLAINVLVVGCIALAAGLLVVVLNARAIVAPVDSVRRALLRVESGELDQRLSVYDATELGLLQAGFNRMSAGLAERERLRDLFGRHVGRDVALAAVDGEVELGGEVRVVTVLFVDVIGSTTIAAQRPPGEVVDLLNDFFAVVVEEVDRHGGLVNKFMGDAVLAIFGAPVAVPDHATRGLRAARAMIERLDVECPDLGAGIGVSTGETVAGNVGAASRLEYTVIGDAVNAASRLTDLAKSVPGSIAVAGESVAAATADEAARWQRDAGHPDPVLLRGRAVPTEIFVRSM